MLAQFPDSAEFVMVSAIVSDNIRSGIGWDGWVDTRVDRIHPRVHTGMQRGYDLVVDTERQDETKVAIRTTANNRVNRGSVRFEHVTKEPESLVSGLALYLGRRLGERL